MIGSKLVTLIISAIAIATASFGCTNKEVKSSSAANQEKPIRTVKFVCNKLIHIKLA